ncbi:response regulator transcription factor [Chromobacterium haemolyticum]|uniref:response regulator transcription factor n=1 Tax=Chromobacterium haemolyticum TaxID=394935 RepID=UPI00196519DB|nr:response regulator transcription factor [Chromobacterium haemolyticum]
MTKACEKKISIIILDDHDLIRIGLEVKLMAYPDLKITGSYASSQQLLAALRESIPDVLLMDFTLSDNEIDGLNLIQSIRVRYPSCKILVLSASDLPGTINIMLKAGARGFFSKSQPVEALAAAIRTVNAGRIYLTPQVMSELNILLSDTIFKKDVSALDPFAKLSPREREVVRCCLDGMGTKQIAEKFSRSIKTISTQKHAAFQKLGIQTDQELFVLNAKLR